MEEGTGKRGTKDSSSNIHYSGPWNSQQCLLLMAPLQIGLITVEYSLSAPLCSPFSCCNISTNFSIFFILFLVSSCLFVTHFCTHVACPSASSAPSPSDCISFILSTIFSTRSNLIQFNLICLTFSA